MPAVISRRNGIVFDEKSPKNGHYVLGWWADISGYGSYLLTEEENVSNEALADMIRKRIDSPNLPVTVERTATTTVTVQVL